LNFRAGDIVEVRGEREILATLDEQGRIDGMPFMPEMLEYCGKRFRVYKRADKTCDTITKTGSRRLYNTVHLDGGRCNGLAHGGCQALCQLFWKEAWLRRVDDASTPHPRLVRQAQTASCSSPAQCSRERLFQLTQTRDGANGDEIRYQCQATSLLEASQPLPWWDIRQYVREIRSGNVALIDVVKSLLFRLFYKTVHICGYRAQIWLYNWLQSRRGGTPFPYRSGTLDKTPRETLNAQPGEWVEVKSYSEILKTLNKRNRNQGLFFDAEMVPYCASTRRVIGRVERIIDECTGRMITLSSDCLILEGAVCRGKYSEKRLFCPRNAYAFWREIWLKRAANPPSQVKPANPETVAACHRGGEVH
jgi:hypothetical protein